MKDLPPDYRKRNNGPDGYNDSYGWSINEWILIALLVFVIWSFL